MKFVKIVEKINEEDKKKIIIPIKSRKYYIVVNINLQGLARSIAIKELEKIAESQKDPKTIEQKAEEIVKKILRMKLVL